MNKIIFLILIFILSSFLYSDIKEDKMVSYNEEIIREEKK